MSLWYNVTSSRKMNNNGFFFNVKIEFNPETFDEMVFRSIENNIPGYCCSIEANNITIANYDHKHLNVLNNSLVNNCDGSVLAKIFAFLYHKNYDSYISADIFIKYIKLKKYRHYFLGNTSEVLCGLKKFLTTIDSRISDMHFETLPFLNVEEFDYIDIAHKINRDNPDLIWVSLGAPKQEQFMSRLKPHLKRGVMLGCGANFNFFSGIGSMKRAPDWMLKARLEWLYRAIQNPKKNIPRYLNFIINAPRLIYNEWRDNVSNQ